MNTNNEIILKDNQSDHFIRIDYPDGQHNIILNLEMLDVKVPVVIRCRIKFFSELEVLGCLVAALKRHDHYIRHIEFVYLFGVRDDRSFSEGNPNYFRDVLAPIINSYKVDIHLLWPFSPLPVVKRYLYPCFCQSNLGELLQLNNGKNYDLVIAGDKSANCFYSVRPNTYFIKKRIDSEFEIGLAIESIPPNVKSILIVDDLCDAGGTFIAEAKYLKAINPDFKLSLFIYHGLFTKGLDPLLEYFDEIICSNSYQGIDHPRVKQINVI